MEAFERQANDVVKKDEMKEKRLNELGVAVLRFQDEEVYNEIENVLRVIENYIIEVEKTHPH